MTNPYRPSTAVELTDSRQAYRFRTFLAALVFLGTIGIAPSGVLRFNSYGGFEVLKSMSASERGSAAMWAATHIYAVLSTLILLAGILTFSTRKVLLGALLFCSVCVFAWAWPMDFLWFG